MVEQLPRLPSGWEFRELGTLIEISYGKGLPKRKRDERRGIPVYGSNGVVGFHSAALTKGRTIIIGRKGSIGALHFCDVPCWPIDTTYYIDDFPANLGHQYLYWFLKSQSFQSLDRSAAIPGIRREDLYKTRIPVPCPSDSQRSLAEQRRIVARIKALLAEVSEARALHERIAEETGKLMDAALREVFSDLDGAEWRTVREAGDPDRDPVQTGPFGAQLKSSEFVESGVPVLAIGNVRWGHLDTSELKYVTTQKAAKLARYKIKAGDILFTRMGTVGRCCVVPAEADGWLISYHLLRVSVDTRRYDPRYLSYCFRGAPRIEEQIRLRTRGATRAGVNTTILADLRFPAVPLPKQHHIIVHLDGIRDQVNAMHELQARHETLLDQLEQSILAQAFQGQL